MAGVDLSDTDGDYWLGMIWLDNPANTSWTAGGDARDPDRRLKVVRRLVRRFGSWSG
jgi:hypothetical protein